MIKRKFVFAIAVLFFCSPGTIWAANSSDDTGLDIYFLDMMGGASTLIVTPVGESILIDTGSLIPDGRDANRIYAATQRAGLEQIDLLITTHFHGDHFGGVSQLVEKIPIKRFMDKGSLPPAKERERPRFKDLYTRYEKVTGGQVDTIRPGDDIPLRTNTASDIPRLRIHCVSAEKKVEGFSGDIDAPAGGFVKKFPDESDNVNSIALVLSYGDFKFFAGGDITWNLEHHLRDPKNIVGPVDAYQVTHHGLDQSNNPVLLHALQPTVSIAMNGPKKGIQPNSFQALNSLSSMKDLYQIHYNIDYGDSGNAPIEFIANGRNAEGGSFIRLSVTPDASEYSVALGEDGPVRTYTVRNKIN